LYQFIIKQVTPLKPVTIERDSCTNSTNCNSNLKLIMEITTKQCYCEGLEIDLMQSFFKLFISQHSVFELQLGVFVLFFEFSLLFSKALKSSPHVELQYFGFLLNFKELSIFCVFHL